MMECGEERVERKRPHEGDCAGFFPDDIKGLLKKLVCETVMLTYKNCCKEKVKIECISGDLLVAKEDGMYKFINIDCICAVSVCCEVILNRIISPFGCK